MYPNRSILSVPGHIEKMHKKARESSADCILFDLEDSVPAEKKDEARRQVIQSIKTGNFAQKRVTVRCNAVDTPFAYRDITDIAEALNDDDSLSAFVVPKVNHSGDIHFVHHLLAGIELSKKRSIPIGIEASIESSYGMERVSSIASASDRLKSLVFGVADFSFSINARLKSISGHGENESQIYPGHRWHYALSRLIIAAKANHLKAIDAPYGNFTDLEGLKRASSMAAALGCDGKWAIHPSQIDIINEVFSPTREDIERARKVLDAHRVAREKGYGATSVDGRMVDQATIRMARQLYDEAIAYNLIRDESGM